MTQRLVCPKCTWPTAPSDSYCSWCGETLRGLRCDPGRLVVAAEAGSGGLELLGAGRVVVQSTGDLPLVVYSAKGNGGFSAALDPPLPGKNGLVLKTGDTLAVTVEGSGATDTPSTIEIGTSIGVLQIPCEAVDTPPIHLSLPETITVPNDRVSTVHGALELDSGSCRIRALRSESQGVSIEPASEPALGPWSVGPGKALQVNLHIDPRHVVDGEARVVMVLEGGITLGFSLSIETKSPARIFPADDTRLLEIRPPMCGKEVKRTLRLKNTGELACGISEPRVSWQEPPPDGIVVSVELKRTKGKGALRLPAKLEPGAELNLVVRVASSGNVTGKWNGKITLVGGGGTGEETSLLDLGLEIMFEEPQEFRGRVAFDFGTVWCAATAEEGNNMRTIQFPADSGDEEKSPVLPSDVVIEGDEKGNLALKLAFPSYIGLEKIVIAQDLKRRIGLDGDAKGVVKVYNGGSIRNIPARDLAAFVVKQLVCFTEQALESRVKRIVVTHPSMFNRARREAIRELFRGAGIANIQSMDEAVAAACGTLAALWKEKLPAAGERFVLLYDMGGGTTDVTLIKITIKGREAGGRICIPEVIAVTGNAALGGRDVTDLLVENYLQEMDPEDRKRFEVDGEPKTDPESFALAVQNRYRIFRACEQAKIGYTEKTKERGARRSPKSAGAKVKGDILPPLEIRPALLDSSKNVVTGPRLSLEGKRFEKLVLEWLEPMWTNVANMVRRGLPKKRGLDMVILSGQSSTLPMIRTGLLKVLEKSLSDTQDIRWARNPATGKADLKGVVSAGALFLTHINDEGDAERPIVWSFKELFEKMTGRYGCQRSDGTFQELLGPSGSTRLVRRLTWNEDGLTTYVHLYENMGQTDRIEGNPDCTLLESVTINVPYGLVGEDEDPKVIVELSKPRENSLTLTASYGNTELLSKEIDIS